MLSLYPRGLFVVPLEQLKAKKLLSVLTEVIRTITVSISVVVSCPRTYGGYSSSSVGISFPFVFSPYTRRLFGISNSIPCFYSICPVHTRGLFRTTVSSRPQRHIFFVLTEVIRSIGLLIIYTHSVPRTYGGYSHIGLLIIDDIQLSSYPRGLFQ